ncbi:similar to Saccharomyces cerevisiae YHR146W CRP1 Protein that binds to cruciform DNA structures [Maudiozyma saulgeensis]|uniref:Similar to Saccharomyces cerevisiae YHR146W CRP1 Protein that binds to cruciform DNA structures n=1 Tax=Maudiozyma saulgeensis TaxID=1789683 RepID=A0A1X7R794_9SACH|nr:similar to Saccharomyces cerevisiae YHR146W CRP1 Protein that binds to cruciform DNA structures [Kazachstania saulgeensis]
MSVTTKNYEFTWPAGPKDVVLTGIFDEWKGTMPLVRQADGSFALTFPIQKTDDSDKFVFKFIVDGNWTVSDSYKKEADAGGIENNYVDLTSVNATGSANVTKIPEAGGLPIVSADASGSATPTPTPKPTRAPPSTSNRKKGKKGKKMKVKKRIRRNKKTGERTVMSQEVEEMDTSATNTPAEEGTEEEDTEDGANDEETSESATPVPATIPAEPTTTAATAAAVTAPVVAEAEQEMHTLPVDQNKATTQFEDTTAIAQTGPGPVLPSNPEEIKEFTEVSEVDADELNARLNKELKEEEENEENEKKSAEKEQPVEPKVEETQATQTLDPKINATTEEPVVEQVPVAAEETAPVATEQKKPETTAQPQEKKKSSTKSKTTKKTIPVATKNSEQNPKKKGIFGKLKSLFK